MLQRLVLGALCGLVAAPLLGLLAPVCALGRGSRQAEDAGSQDAAAAGDEAHEENVVRGFVVRFDRRTVILDCIIHDAV